MQKCNTHEVKIYMGLRSGYSEKVMPFEMAFKMCKDYCDKVKLGLTITLTNFVYVEGDEPGIIVGLINYPRFPDTTNNINEKAYTLAKILMKNLEQERCSVVTPFKTFMFEKEDL